jgi:glycosyltransferase involved in cell wall biosynthesis
MRKEPDQHALPDDGKNARPEISVIIPAYRERDGIAGLVGKTRRVMEASGRTFEILVVDDGSNDGTDQEAREAGALVFTHPYNIGNGAAIKTGIRRSRGEVLVMMDGDAQHDPENIPHLLDMIGRYDMAVGARSNKSETCFHRDIANHIYNWLASYICGRKIKDLTSGFRAVKANIARDFLYLLPNTFSYPTTITLAVVRSGHSLTYVPIRTTRRVGKSKIRLLKDGSRFFFIILRIATLFSPMKVFLPVSALMFFTGFGYGLIRILFFDGRYGPTSAMLMTMAVVVFMVGLVSEQVTQLRFDRRNTNHDEDYEKSRRT